MSNSKLALVSGPKLYKTIDKQITDITGNKLKLAFIFETIDSLTTYIKNDEDTSYEWTKNYKYNDLWSIAFLFSTILIFRNCYSQRFYILVG